MMFALRQCFERKAFSSETSSQQIVDVHVDSSCSRNTLFYISTNFPINTFRSHPTEGPTFILPKTAPKHESRR
jgi:hypothetical protein